MTRLGQHNVAAFSPDAALFAVVGTSNIRVFDSGNRRLVATLSRGAATANKSQTFQQFTSLSWGHRAAQANGSLGVRTLAVGTATGCVLAFDVSLGELLWEVTTGLEGGVTALASSWQGGFIATGAGGRVVHLQPASGTVQSSWQGGRYTVTALAAAENGRLVLSSATVSIWDAAEQKRLFKFSGHATSATTIASTLDGRYAVSAAPGERAVAVWDASGKPRGKVRTAAASLPLEASAAAVEVCSASGAGGKDSLLVAALTEHGDACVWRCMHGAEQGTEQSPGTSFKGQQVLHIRAKKQGVKSVGIHAASILAVKLDVGSDGSAWLVLARGSAKPLFERLAIPLLGEELAQVTLKPMQGGALLSQDTVPSGQQPAVAAAGGHSLMLGAENDGATVAQRPLAVLKAIPLEAGGSSKRRRAAESDVGTIDAGLAGDEAATGSDDIIAMHGSTFGERVAALRVAELSAPVADNDQQPADGSITADSLSVLLSQALRSGDRSLLERCLNISNPRIIENTVGRLAACDAAVFLQAVVSRLQSRPARGQELLHWIRSVLLQHTAYLMCAPGAQSALSALYQSVQARRATHESLLALAGRLELVHAQLDKATNDVHMHIKPQVVFHDDDEDDERTDFSIGWKSDESDTSGGESDE